jgi:hypothetical protein
MYLNVYIFICIYTYIHIYIYSYIYVYTYIYKYTQVIDVHRVSTKRVRGDESEESGGDTDTEVFKCIYVQCLSINMPIYVYIYICI